jgi:Zn-dependent protease
MEKTEDLILQILNSSLAELKNVVIENRQYIDAELLFRLGELANVAKTAAERERYIGASDYLLLTLEGVDSKASEAISKVIVNEVNDSRMQPSDISTTNREPLSYTDPTLSGDMLRKWIERTLQSSSINTTNIETFPQFIPPSLVPFVLRSYESPLKQDDLETLRKEVFTMDTFYVTAVESTPVLSLFRGNLRSDSAEVFKRVQQKLSAVPGLADRVQVFLMPDPTPEAVRRMEMMKDGMNGPLPDPDPVFVVISKAAEPFAQGWPILLLTVLCGLGSVFTTFSYAIGTYAFNSEFLSKLSEGDTSVVAKTLPVLFALLGVQLLHELGHTVAAKFHGIKLSPPILIPSLQLGSFGAITRILSFPKDRIALFDVAVAGPMLGMIASFALLAFGLWTTGHTASPEDLANFPVIPAAIFRSSLLVGLVTEFLQPNAISSLATVPVAVSPLTLAAISGLLVNALNLMPVGRLDGGRMSTATLGRRAAGNVGNLVLLVQVSLSLNS